MQFLPNLVQAEFKIQTCPCVSRCIYAYPDVSITQTKIPKEKKKTQRGDFPGVCTS